MTENQKAIALILGFFLTILMACRGTDAIPSKAAETETGVPRAELVTRTSAGPVRIGMTIAEARKAMPGVAFARTMDGDGVALVELKRGEKLEMMLYGGEADPQSPIDENAKVEVIIVWGPAYKTAEGVHPGMPLSEVEKKYGKVVKIRMSEIESREYAEFERQPAGLQFRTGLPEVGIVGTYPQGSLETKVFSPSAVVSQIEIYQ